MANQSKPSFPAIRGTIERLDPRPGIRLDTSRFQHLVHQLIVSLEVFASQRHLVSPRLIVVQEEFVVVVPIRAYNIVDRNLRSSHSRIQFIHEGNLPVIPAKVGLTLARVNDINIDLTIVKLRFLPLHRRVHFLHGPHLGCRLHSPSVVILDPVDKGLESFDMHCSEDDPPSGNVRP